MQAQVFGGKENPAARMRVEPAGDDEALQFGARGGLGDRFGQRLPVGGGQRETGAPGMVAGHGSPFGDPDGVTVAFAEQQRPDFDASMGDLLEPFFAVGPELFHHRERIFDAQGQVLHLPFAEVLVHT